MEKKNLITLIIVICLIVLVILFWDKFIIKKEEIVERDYCEQDSDCVLAVNPYSCCIEPIPMNKNVVEVDEELVVYDKLFDYSLYETKEDCDKINCPTSLIISLDVDLTCFNNKCLLNNSN